MSLIDFKFTTITGTGKGVTVIARFYEGSITTEDEWSNVTKKPKPVTRYRRTKLLAEKKFSFDGGPSMEMIVDTLKAELEKDPKHTPIDEQKTSS